MMTEEQMDAVFHALSSADRRRILDILRNHPGACVKEVSLRFRVSRIMVLKHLRVLEEAGLVISEQAGRHRRLFLNTVPLQVIHDRWTTDFSAFWSQELLALKHRIESAPKGEEVPHGG